MVKVKKELTHIYHENVNSELIAIGSSTGQSVENIELFKKTLALTSDLKRLPFLLGGKVYIWADAHALYNMFTSVITGISADVLLMNGHYNDDDFGNINMLLADQKAKDDILMHGHGLLQWQTRATDGIAISINLDPSHWDFEGNVPLYDEISLLLYIDTDTNVASVDYAAAKIKGYMEIEVDWRPFSSSELQEFIMEHIYAKQGD